MDIVIDSIKCSICNEILKSPVNLPCGHCICKQHENEAIGKRTIECSICEESYDIPAKRFAPNKPLEILLKKRIEKIDLGEEHNSAKEKFKLFADLLENFERIKNDPEMRIHTVISEMREKIDLRREDIKNEIDKEALAMIDNLNEFEKVCKSNVNSIDKSDNTGNLDEKLELMKKDLKQWQLNLSTFESNSEIKKTILNKSISHLKELQTDFNIFNDKLFLNRLDTFQCKFFLTMSNFNTISVEVKELSKCKDIKEVKPVISHDIKAVGIDWRLYVNIEQYLDSNKVNYIGAYLNATQKPRNPNLKIEFDFVILDRLAMGKSVIKNIVKKFESDAHFGSSDLINLGDLLNNYNLYDFQNDSCTIQVQIRKIEGL